MRERFEYTKTFRKALWISALAHVVLLAGIFASPSMRLSLVERPMRITWVELPKGTSDEIGLGIKKTEGLPRSTIEEQKMLKTPDQQTLPPTKPRELEKAPEARKSEIEKRPKMEISDKKVRKSEEPPKSRKDTKIQSALAKIDRQLKNRSVVPESAQVKVNEEGYKYGTSTKPLKVLPSDPEYLKYQAQVRWKIMREWVVPVKFTEEGASLNTKLEVLINLDGDVVTVRWASRSGNESFDQSALRAIKKASPFPKPPDRLAWEAYNEGFLIEFDPRIKARY